MNMLEVIKDKFNHYGTIQITVHDIEWLIEQAERVKNYQKDIELKNNLMAVLKHSNRHYQIAFETLENDYEKLKEENKNLKDELTKYVLLVAESKGWLNEGKSEE